jgi:hypothetical protein
VYFRSETKGFGSKPSTPSPIKNRISPDPSSLNMKNKLSSNTTKYKQLDLEVISEHEETPFNLEKERTTKLKARRIINHENAIEEAVEIIRKTEEDEKKEEVEEKKEEIFHENNNQEIDRKTMNDIDMMLINNDEQYRYTEAKPVNNDSNVFRKSVAKKPSSKLEVNDPNKQLNTSLESYQKKSAIKEDNKEAEPKNVPKFVVEDKKQEDEVEDVRIEIDVTPIDVTPHEGVVLEHKLNKQEQPAVRESKPNHLTKESHPSTEIFNKAMRDSKPKKEEPEDHKFSEGNKELSDIEKADMNGNESDMSKDSIFINLKSKPQEKKITPKEVEDSMFTDSEFVTKQEKIPIQANIKPSEIRESNYDNRMNFGPQKNPFIPQKSNENNTDLKNTKYTGINEDLRNQQSRKEPIDIILGQREGKANAFQHVENSISKINNNEKVDLNLESLNIVLKNKNQQSFISNQKGNNVKSNVNNKQNINNAQSSSEHFSSKENKDSNPKSSSKMNPKFGAFLQSYCENFANPDIRSLNSYKSGLNMLGVKSLQEKLREKVPSKNYSSRLGKFIRSFTPNSVKDILELNMKVELINMYFCLLQIYNDFLSETQKVDKVKIFDISLFLNLQECFTNGNFESMMAYFKEDDIFTAYKKIIIPIYVENNMDVNENLILSVFDINAHVIYFYDAKGILICDMNISNSQ